MSSIYVIRHDAPAGPFSEEDVRGQLARGELTAADFAWRDGMADWQPLTSVLALPTAPPPRPHPDVPPSVRQKAARPAKKKGRVPPAHVLAGLTEFLEVYPDRLVITPKGGAGLQVKAKGGAPGIRDVPMHLLLSIAYKLPGFTSGYLQIVVAGGGDDGGELLFRFAKSAENNDAAGRITTFVEGKIHEARSVPTALSAAGLSDELTKLAALHTQGVLTDAEFKAAKERLLA